MLEDIKTKYEYQFLRFDQEKKPPSPKIIYLRHDVDISPHSALQLGVIEKDMNISANFFFQIGAETYNIFNKETITIIEQLKSFQHCVGLHIDPTLFGTDDKSIQLTLKWFKECITDIDFVVSFHRPAQSLLNQTFPSFLNTYQSDFFHSSLFLSDSRKNTAFYSKLIALLDQNKSPIQLLLHPVWWYPEENLSQLKDEIIKRRVLEISNYLKTNFQNFKELIKDEDCSFRV